MSYQWSNNNSSIITCSSDHHSSSHRIAHQSSINKQPSSNDQQAAAAAAVRSRWSPKPEQILILESVFNSGMVNPPKDETVRIRMLLENYGPVVDANVFYWFQNRRSKSRRLQRQIQANMIKAPSTYTTSLGGGSSSIGFNQDVYDTGSLATPDAYFPYQRQHGGVVVDNKGGFMTVFINGVATEIPVGPVDMREVMCGQDNVVLLHSSGHQVPVSGYGFSTYYTLQHGESYFLVDKSIM